MYSSAIVQRNNIINLQSLIGISHFKIGVISQNQMGGCSSTGLRFCWLIAGQAVIVDVLVDKIDYV
jgi:hypothetical protein